MRSFIVRIYRRSPDGAVSGTVQPVGGAAQPQAPAAFASADELLHHMKASPPVAAPAVPPAAAAPAAAVKARRRRPG